MNIDEAGRHGRRSVRRPPAIDGGSVQWRRNVIIVLLGSNRQPCGATTASRAPRAETRRFCCIHLGRDDAQAAKDGCGGAAERRSAKRGNVDQRGPTGSRAHVGAERRATISSSPDRRGHAPVATLLRRPQSPSLRRSLSHAIWSCGTQTMRNKIHDLSLVPSTCTT